MDVWYRWMGGWIYGIDGMNGWYRWMDGMLRDGWMGGWVAVWYR